MRSLVALTAAMLGCSPGIEGNGGPNGVDAATPNNGDKPEFLRYRGTLGATQSIPFGGMGFCTYSVLLQNVDVDVVLRAGEELAAMSIEDTMAETVVGSCPYTAEPPSRQMFSHDSARPVPATAEGRVEPTLAGITANRPMTNATALVTVEGGTVQATARWERVDQGPPLKWIISTTAPITLQPQNCTPNAGVCVGGAQGSLYTCDDGSKMKAVRKCATGCNAAKTACN